MADKNSYEASLAQAVHDCEHEVAVSNAAPAGPNRIERISEGLRKSR